MMVAIDFQKAYDSVSLDLLQVTLLFWASLWSMWSY